MVNLVITENSSPLFGIRFILSPPLPSDCVVKFTRVGDIYFLHFTDRGLAHMITLDNVACVEMTTFQFKTEVFRHATDFYAYFSVTGKSRVSLGSSSPFSLGSRVNTYSTELRLTLIEETSPVKPTM